MDHLLHEGTVVDPDLSVGVGLVPVDIMLICPDFEDGGVVDEDLGVEHVRVLLVLVVLHHHHVLSRDQVLEEHLAVGIGGTVPQLLLLHVGVVEFHFGTLNRLSPFVLLVVPHCY